MPKSKFREIMEKTAEINALSEDIGILDLQGEIVAILDQNPSVKALVWYMSDGYISCDCGARAGLPWEMQGFKPIFGDFPELEEPSDVDYFDDLYYESDEARPLPEDKERVTRLIDSFPEKIVAEHCGLNAVVFAWRGGILVRPL